MTTVVHQVLREWVIHNQLFVAPYLMLIPNIDHREVRHPSIPVIRAPATTECVSPTTIGRLGILSLEGPCVGLWLLRLIHYSCLSGSSLSHNCIAGIVWAWVKCDMNIFFRERVGPLEARYRKCSAGGCVQCVH